MIGDTAQLAVELKLKDQQFQSAIAKDERSLSKLNATVGKTGGAFKFASDHVGSFSKNMHNAVGNLGKGVSTAAHNIERMAFVAGALAVGGGIAAVKWAGDFEAQLRTINTIARETPEGLGRIGDSIREIARTTGTPLEELTQGYYDLLSAGIKAADAQNVLTNANKLAIGGLASAAETVDLLTTAINVYGGDASQAGRFTDEFAKAIERGKVTASELAGSYAQVAPLAKSLGIENKELAAGYATLTAAGTPAAEAATQMASAMTALLKTTPGLEDLQKQTGKNYAALAGSQGFNVALEQMQVDAKKAGIELIDLVGRKEALLYILQTTGPNLRKYNADLAAMGDSAGTAAEQMSERQQGLNYQLSILKAGIKDAGITIGSALIPKLVPLIQKLNEFLSGHQDDIRRFGTDLANAFENVAKFIGQLDFRQIGDSLKMAAGFAKGLVSAFLSAPQWLQTAVVTGWGLNKLTGGAVQNVMADLTKAALGGVLSQYVQRGSSAANPLFVSDVTGGAAGGILAGGKWATIGKIIGGAFAVSAAAAIAQAIHGPLDDLATEIHNNLIGDDNPLSDFGEAWNNWRQNADWPFGQKNAPDWAYLNGTPPPKAGTVSPDWINTLQGSFGLAYMANASKDDRVIVTGLGAHLTALQVQIHADLQAAVSLLKTSTDPTAIALAAAQIVESVRGGAGGATSTKNIVAELTAKRDAALATGDKATADALTTAIKQIEPFAKGRQWQAEQIAEARKIADSAQSQEQKTEDLKRIQADLLAHNRTMAADIVAGLLGVVDAVKNIKINAMGGILYEGGGRAEKDDVVVPGTTRIPRIVRPPRSGPQERDGGPRVSLTVAAYTSAADNQQATVDRNRTVKPHGSGGSTFNI